MPIAVASGVTKRSTNRPYDLGMRAISSGNHTTNLPMAGNSTTFKVGKVGRGGVQKVQLVFPLFHINQSTSVEELNTGVGTFKAALNYPVGSANWYNFAFGGNVSGSLGSTGISFKSDILDLGFRIPEDAMVGWMTEAKWAGGDGSVFNALSLGRNEWVEFSNTDYMTGHTKPASPQAGAGYAPILVGETHEPAFFIHGDSRTEGQNASQFGDQYGDRAFAEVWVSQRLRLGYVNAGLNGDSLVDSQGNNTMRLAFGQACGCTHLALFYGVNDLITPGTVGAFAASRVPLIISKAKTTYGFRRAIVNVPAGRAQRIGNTGTWAFSNQEAYNANFVPSDATSQWGIMQTAILAMRPDTDGVDMVLTTERDYCHASPYDPRGQTTTGGLSVFDGDGVHEKAADHPVLGLLHPPYERIPS